MANQNKHNGIREFKAIWAADEDWKKHRSESSEQEQGWALRQFNKIEAKFNEAVSRREEDRLPWYDRLKRLPICAVRSIPLVATLTVTYWFVALVIAWLTSGDVNFSTLSLHWLEVSYMASVLAVLVGYREARYPEGVLKPSLKHLLNYIRSDWFFLLPAIGILSFIGMENDANSDPMALQIFMIGVLVLAIFWTTDLAAYKPMDREEKQ